MLHVYRDTSTDPELQQLHEEFPHMYSIIFILYLNFIHSISELFFADGDEM